MGHNARLIVHHGYGHSSRDPSSCTDAIARAYLVNGTVPDARETDCYADEKPYLYGVKAGEVSAAGQVVGGDPVAAWEAHVAVMRTWYPWLLR